MPLNNELVFDEKNHIYSMNGRTYVSVTQAIRMAGIGEDFSIVDPAILRAGQERGTAVHKVCEQFQNGLLSITVIS